MIRFVARRSSHKPAEGGALLEVLTHTRQTNRRLRADVGHRRRQLLVLHRHPGPWGSGHPFSPAKKRTHQNHRIRQVLKQATPPTVGPFRGGQFGRMLATSGSRNPILAGGGPGWEWLLGHGTEALGDDVQRPYAGEVELRLRRGTRVLRLVGRDRNPPGGAPRR